MSGGNTRISYVGLVREAARWSVVARKQDALYELARLLERAENECEASSYSIDNRVAFADVLSLVRKFAAGYTPGGE